MKETIETYGELKNLISRGEKVTMKERLMNHAKLSEIPLSDIKLFIAQGYFQVEAKTDLVGKSAIEGEFISKGDEDYNEDRRRANAQLDLIARQRAANNREVTGNEGLWSPSPLFGAASGLLGGMFGRGY